MRILIIISIILPIVILSQPVIQFDKKVHKFPETKEGALLKHEYLFTNKGDQPLIIEAIKVSCTCTKFKYPEQPILPNKNGSIHVSFDTHKKYAWQDRILTIYSNAKNNPVKIRFKVMIKND